MVAGKVATHEHFKTIVRKRPVLPLDCVDEASPFDCVSCEGSVAAVHEQKMKVDGITPMIKTTRYPAHAVLETDNDTLYDTAVRPLIRTVASGAVPSATILAYGQTNSGKTYTINGVLDRAIPDMLHAAGRVEFQAMEMLGKITTDMATGERLMVCETDHGVMIKGEVWIEFDGPDALLRAVRRAMAKRVTVATARNHQSSRSHAIYTFKFPGGGRLRLLDLAGSETSADQLFHDKDRVQETVAINKSLMALKDCFKKTAEHAKYIPFRGNQLTLLIKDAFIKGPGSIPTTLIFVNVSPLLKDIRQTVASLRYSALICAAADRKDSGPMAWSKSDVRTWIEATLGFCPPVLDGVAAKSLFILTENELKTKIGQPNLAKSLYDAIYTLKQASKKPARRPRQ